LHGGIYFLIDRGNSRNARTGMMYDGSEMIKPGFDVAKYIENPGWFRITSEERINKSGHTSGLPHLS
jgi:hypothetical protein